MKKQMIENLQKALPSVFSAMKTQGKSHLTIDYDKEADVIYFNFDTNNIADDSEIYNDDIVVRKRNNDIIGITVLHASTFLK